MAVEYKFKPYTPQNLKLATPQASLTQEERTRKSLESQRANLDARLRAEGIDPDTLGGEFDNRNLIEKALNITPDQNFLFDFFEVIERPLEALKNTAMAGLEGENLLEGFWEGLSGQRRVTSVELLKEATGLEPQTGVGKFLTNVAGDIALDPLTYIPGGFFLKGFKKIGGIGSKTITATGEEIISNSVKLANEVIQQGTPGFIKTADEMNALITGTRDYLAKGQKGALAEGMAVSSYERVLQDYIRKNGLVDAKDAYKIVLEGAQKTKGGANLKDLAIYFKTGDNQFVKIARTEVKDVVKNAFAFKGAFSLEDITQDLITKGNGSAFVQRVKGMKTLDGRNVSDILEQGLQTTGANRGKFNFFSEKNFTSDQIKEIQEVVKDVLFEDLAKSGIGYMSFRINANRVITMSVENARKYLRITKADFGKLPSGTLTNKAITQIAKTKGIITDNLKFFKTSSKAKNAAEFYGKAVTSLVDDATSTVGSGNILIKGLSKDDAVKLLGEGVQEASGAIKKITGVGILDDGTIVLKGTSLDAINNQISTGLDLAQPGATPDKFLKMTEDFIDANNLDESEAFIDGLLRGSAQQTGITETITLAGRARAGEFDKISPYIKRVANAIKKFELNFKINFNLTAGFSQETKDLILKAYGQNLFELERRSARLTEIKQQLIKADPDAGPLLGEIIEANAKVQNGKIVKMKRRMGTSDFLDYIFVRTQDKVDVLLPKFPNEAAKNNFLKSLNKMYRDFEPSLDDFFDVVEKGAGTKLVFDGDSKSIEDFIKWFNEQKAAAQMGFAREIPDYIQFGEKALSSKTQKFLLQNADQVEKYRELSEEILQELVDVAGFDNLPRELAGQIGYMRHTMTMEAYKALQRQMPEVASIFARPGTDTLKARRFIGSAEEVNAGLREFGGLELDLFDPNAFNAMEDLVKIAHRKLDQSRVLDIILTNKGINAEDLMRVVDNTQDFAKTLTPYDTMFKSFKEEFSALHENLSPAAKETLENFFKKQGYVDGKAVVMNKSAYNVLKGAEKAYLDIPPLIKTYDKFLNFWKGTTLVSPGFHLRNLFGNMFNSYAAGMDLASQGKYLTTAVTELDEFQKIGKKLAQGLDLTSSEREIFDVVRGYFEGGTSQTHRGIRDLEQLKAGVDASKGVGKFKTGYNNVLKFNFNVAEKMDDVQRYALYRWALDTTGDTRKASNKVAEALFDYSHLTPFEKDYMKRIFPFYTFMKNNFVFQAKQIFANPKAYARTGRAYKYAIEDLAGYSPEDLPDYATENMWLPIPMTVTKGDTKAIAFLKANLPLSDFTELVENPFSKGVTSLTAPVKLLIEFGAGRDMFTGAPLQNFPGETRGLEPGTGVLAGLRDPRGNLTISQSPIAQKILNDIGLRTPLNLASTGLDVIDTLAGYQGTPEGLGDFMARMGLVGIQETENLELTKLYQDLEKLRELKKYYEQETGNQLPVLP